MWIGNTNRTRRRKKIEEIVLINYTLPPKILQNPNFEGSIVDIYININNPDFFHGDKPISISIYKNKVSTY